ncbi:MAG TPA: thioesterase family protein [Aquabacterium sp.]|nr:thioesterase family protein [Aquabacterium sp.]
MSEVLIESVATLLARRQVEGSCAFFEVGEDWGQGRTLFGGLLSALAVQAMRDVCGADWPLRALQTSFVGPVAPGRFEIEVHLLRQGKNVRQVQAHIRQGHAGGAGAVAGVLLAVFGTGRDSTLSTLMPALVAPAQTADACMAMPFIPGLTPAFTQHLEFRQAEGAYPFTGASTWSTRIYTRLRAPQGVDSELMSVMLADAGPTPALAQLKAPAPASSVSWALELRPVSIADEGAAWLMDKDALAVAEGYVNERTTLWTPDGQLAALGYQVVAVYG